MTRQRLYLDAQEQILSSVSKVVVDQKAGSMLYLPIDKLINSNAVTNLQQSQPVQPLNPQALPGAAAEQAVDRTRDAFRSRDRESR